MFPSRIASLALCLSDPQDFHRAVFIALACVTNKLAFSITAISAPTCLQNLVREVQSSSLAHSQAWGIKGFSPSYPALVPVSDPPLHSTPTLANCSTTIFILHQTILPLFCCFAMSAAHSAMTIVAVAACVLITTSLGRAVTSMSPV